MSVSIYSRYYGLDAVQIDGRVSLAARPPVPPGEDPASLLHVLVAGETLDQLARLYYGREDLWWRIADANPRRFAFEWRPGETLVIPPLHLATRTPQG